MFCLELKYETNSNTCAKEFKLSEKPKIILKYKTKIDCQGNILILSLY